MPGYGRSRQFAPSRLAVEARSCEDPDRLDVLADSRGQEVRRNVAGNRHTRATTLARLVENASKWLCEDIAKNPNTDAATLARLATSEHDWVRVHVAAHPNTDAATLATLAQDPFSRVRSNVARHPAAPAALLAASAGGVDRWERIGAARNPHTPAEVLASLASDVDPKVRKQVARNPGTTDGVLIGLLADADFDVRKAVLYRNQDDTRPKKSRLVRRFNGTRSVSTVVEYYDETGGRFSAAVIEAMARSSMLKAVEKAAQQPDAPVEVLRRLSAHENIWVRKSVAENPGTPTDALVALAEDTESEVVTAVANRTAVTAEVAERVASTRFRTAHEALVDRDEVVAMILAEGSPRARLVLARTYPGSGDELTDEAVWDRLVGDTDAQVRKAAVGNCPGFMVDAYAGSPHPQVRAEVAARTESPEVLARLAGDPSHVVRRRVAGHARVPADALATLAGDPNDSVRSAAAERFMAALTNPNA